MLHGVQEAVKIILEAKFDDLIKKIEENQALNEMQMGHLTNVQNLRDNLYPNSLVLT